MGQTTPSGGAKARAPRNHSAKAGKPAPGAWREPFLAALRDTCVVQTACAIAGVCPSSVYSARQRDADFAAAWQAALSRPDAPPPTSAHWRRDFLTGLIGSSCVKAAAATAGIEPGRAYKERSDNAAFAAQWRAALCEGYDLLELELLAYLRDPDSKKKMDVAGATRLLAAHRETVAAQRAHEDHRSRADVLASLDAKLADMRERRRARAAAAKEAAR